MVKKGIIGSLNTNERKAKVVYQDIGSMSPDIPIAKHVDMETIEINSEVIVAIYGDDLLSGAIIGVI